jgi:hypothetical protein
MIMIPLPETDASGEEKQGSLGGNTIALIIMVVLAALGIGGVFLLRHNRKSRHPIPHSVMVVPNPAFQINTDERARTGSIIVTTTADQIQYLIPMVEQAPGEYMEAVARNPNYTYAPPIQSPVDYATIDESPSGGGEGGAGRADAGEKNGGGGRNVDPNGYVVDESSAPVEPGGGDGGRSVDPNGYVVDGSGGPDDDGNSYCNGGSGNTAGDGAARNVVYSSYSEGSTGSASNAAEYGTPAEYGGAVVEAVYGDGPMHPRVHAMVVGVL